MLSADSWQRELLVDFIGYRSVLSIQYCHQIGMGYFDDVRRAVRRIPWGKVATYGDVARAAGRPGAARQVAWALQRADEYGVPWQRVLGSGGRILLPDRAGALQRRLLEKEGITFCGARADLRQFGFKFPKQRDS